MSVRTFVVIYSFLISTLSLAGLAATAIVLFGHVPPLLNQGIRTYRMLNACLLPLLAAMFA